MLIMSGMVFIYICCYWIMRNVMLCCILITMQPHRQSVYVLHCKLVTVECEVRDKKNGATLASCAHGHMWMNMVSNVCFIFTNSTYFQLWLRVPSFHGH